MTAFLFNAAAHSLIRGKVIDAKNGFPLQGASVMITGTENGTVTDETGNFILRSDSAITSILVSYLGYTKKRIEVHDPTAYLIIRLQPAAVKIGEVNVTRLRTNPLKPLATIDVDLRPVNTSQDMLRLIPGLFIAQHAGGGKAEQIFLRGFDMDHGTDISIHVDGMPVNMVSHAHGQGYADLHFLIPETIGDVDFDKGPYSLTHGNLATGGYVDFRTLVRPDKNRIQLELGQFHTQRLVTMFTLPGNQSSSNKQNAYMAGEFFLSDGPFDNSQHFKRYNLFGKYTNYLDQNHLLTIELSLFRSNWDASGQIPRRAVTEGIIDRFGAIDTTEGGITGRKNLMIRLNSNLRDGSNLVNSVYLSGYDFTLYSNFTFFLNDPVNGDEIRQREHRTIYGYTARYYKPHSLGDWKGTLTAGADFRYDAVRDQELSHVRKRFTTLDTINFGDINEINTDLYVGERLSHGNLMFSAGARFDFFTFEYIDRRLPGYRRDAVRKPVVSPKASVTYNFSPQWQIYLKGAGGFHTNDTRDVILSNGNRVIPMAWGSDLGTIWKPAGSLVIQTALWYLYMQQELVFSGDEGTVEPSGRTRRLGVDLSLRYQYRDWLFADMDFNYANPRYLDEPHGQDYVPLAPRFTSTGGIKIKMKNGLGGSLRYRFMSDRPANEDNTITALGYTVVDATVHYMRRRFEIALVAENLFNTDWNEAQFATESRLYNEPEPVTELHFTPGTPFFFKARMAWFF